MPTLTVEIVSDFTCPWCYIGLHRFNDAIATLRQELSGVEVIKQWRPYFLNPDVPEDTIPYLPFLSNKFGGMERLKSVFSVVREAGAEFDIQFQFEKIQFITKTLHAHRLVHWAQQQVDASQLVERIYLGHFHHGENISDINVLADIAGLCGYDREAASLYLASKLDIDLVRTKAHESGAWGVRSVPTFVLERKLAILGAQDSTAFVDAVKSLI
ncbi:DsbA family oxidoreductase [Denitratisoma oestradiolicum]|uniref:Disulfide bond formation protein DsbA n=1 Tax=Denitratisoma oestradiolicum TaxID=311182 RepID=A0A6S6XZF1_9PROT|nr:DsbA family oxidoreductase [Denitratisoma oestradiolicum]TWO78718.1 hypothetical protein CBW56_18580 [Denitratisoma oestradiolicum]CAB1369561.1 Disulfide bond formation protein DsbA [Denitratisoma oestradiolicum]